MKIFIALLMLIPVVANAQVATNAARLTWVPATLDVNNNPLPTTGPDAIEFTRIQRSTGADCMTNFGTVVETLNLPLAVVTAFFENLPAGRWCFRARHIAFDLEQSDWSPVVTKLSVWPVGRPARPVSITIE